MKQTFEERNIKRNEFGKLLIFSTLGIFLFYNALMLFLKYSSLDYKLSINQLTAFSALCIVAYLCYLSLKKDFEFWRIYKILTIGLFSLIFYISLVTCHQSMMICLFYIPIILMVLMQTSLKKAILFSIIILAICYFTPIISEAFQIAYPEQISDQRLKILKYLNYIVAALSGYVSFLVAYYYIELNKIENKFELVVSNDEFIQEDKTPSKKLYVEIIDYMDRKKPYTDPDFSIKSLAKKLKSNPLYVSKALNQEGGKKFADFIQEYRIKQVLTDLDNNTRAMSLQEIYKKAGFQHQSTFNRKFKEFTGTTPSNYMELANKKLESKLQNQIILNG